jgi:hypothetical protein
MNVKIISGTALGSLVFGILGLTTLPLIGPIAAILLAGKAEGQIQSDQTLDGLGLARAGRIMGWIGLALTGAGCLLAMLWFVFAVLGELSFSVNFISNLAG